MKKMIPVYVLQTLMIASIVTFGVLTLRSMKAMQQEIVMIESQQRLTNSPFHTLQVEVVNTPTVKVDEPLRVSVDEPLSVGVDNEPDVNCH